MKLLSYSVAGLRALADVQDIPVGRPTIVTGANDGGKSTALHAIGFLLGDWQPSAEDFQVTGHDPETQTVERVDSMVVTGRFCLSTTEQDELELPREISVRRVAHLAGGTAYELHTEAPEEEKLRDLSARGLAELQAIAAHFDVAASGRRNAKASWLEPLKAYASGLPTTQAWVALPAAVTEFLPTYLPFSSTSEPDPKREIATLLRSSFKEIVADETLTGRIKKIEDEVRTRLRTNADTLVEHIRSRCPDLTEVSITPSVSFKEGFAGVELRAGEGHGVALEYSGAGRRRRISLAVWEWATQLLGAGDVVVAYDEPDVHLDYRRQRELMDLILDQCKVEGVSVLVATHSLNLVDRVDIRDVVHLRRDDATGHTSIDRLLTDEHGETERYLADVSAAMGLRNSVLLHERCFVGVEGPTEAQCLPILFRLACGMSLQAAGIALISGNSNKGALDVARFLNDHGRKVAFIVDKDSETDRSTKRLFTSDNLAKAGIKPEQILTVGTAELEDCFTDEQWAATANRHWQHKEGRMWLPDEFARLREVGKLSKGMDDMIRPEATTAPPGKPGYLLALVQDLVFANEVPKELHSRFADLRELAS